MKDKDKKLDSIKEKTPKLNYFLKNVQVSPKKSSTNIPNVVKPNTENSVGSVVKETQEPKIVNKAEYHDRLFKKTLDDVQHKVNSLLLRKDKNNTTNTNTEFKSSYTHNTDVNNNNAAVYKNINTESFLPVVDKLRTITNNTKKTIIGPVNRSIPEKVSVKNETTKVIPEKTVFNNETTKVIPEKVSVKNETTKVIPEKVSVKNETTKVIPEKTTINKENTKAVPEKVSVKKENTKAVPEKVSVKKENPRSAENSPTTKETVVIRDAKTRNIPQKAETVRSSDHKTENSISNTLNKIEKINKINKNTNSNVKLHGIVDNSKDSIKNVLKKSMLVHNQMNKTAITNTNHENVSKVVNSKNIKSMSPNISNVLTKQAEIPSLAKGGFVENPTIAQIGDAKSSGGKKEGEMVIAPSKLPEILAETSVIEKTQQRTIEKVGEIKDSPTKGLSEIANESLTTNADRKSTQEMSKGNVSEGGNAPVIINQSAQTSGSAPPPSASSGGEKLGRNDMYNVSLPRWRSRMG